jgi:hypothetical protein
LGDIWCLETVGLAAFKTRSNALKSAKQRRDKNRRFCHHIGIPKIFQMWLLFSPFSFLFRLLYFNDNIQFPTSFLQENNA